MSGEAAETISRSRVQLSELVSRLQTAEAIKAQQATDLAGFESRNASLSAALSHMEEVDFAMLPGKRLLNLFSLS